MSRQQKKYDMDYKIQSVKLAKEIGVKKASEELGVPYGTIFGWVKAARKGEIDLGIGEQTPETAMSLVAELQELRKKVKTMNKEIARLKEENEFLEEASAFFVASRQKYAKKSE